MRLYSVEVKLQFRIIQMCIQPFLNLQSIVDSHYNKSTGNNIIGRAKFTFTNISNHFTSHNFASLHSKRNE